MRIKSLTICALMLAVLCGRAPAQMTEEQAYQKMLDKEAARKAAAAKDAQTPPPAAHPPPAAPAQQPAPPPSDIDSASNPLRPTPLLTARRQFRTVIIHDALPPGVARQPADEPPDTNYHIISYRSPVGDLAAYLSADPRDGRRHPAVLWAHGGFDGLSDYYCQPQPPENDQTPEAFRDAGFVVMMPSWRGEGDNPGRFEMFYGEVDDALAAVDYLRHLPSVDPSRIYMLGHNTGGTIALLTAECTSKLRGVFVFGGCPDLDRLMGEPDHYHAPFDDRMPREVELRSAERFITTLTTPTWYFEGEPSPYASDALRMGRTARDAGAPLQVFTFRGRGATHYSILRPITQILAQKLRQDTHGGTCDVQLSPQELADAITAQFNVRPPVRCIVPAKAHIQLTDRAKAAFLDALRVNHVDPAKATMYIEMDPASGRPRVAYATYDNPEGYATESNGMRIVVDDEAAAALGSVSIDVPEDNQPARYVIAPAAATQPAAP